MVIFSFPPFSTTVYLTGGEGALLILLPCGGHDTLDTVELWVETMCLSANICLKTSPLWVPGLSLTVTNPDWPLSQRTSGEGGKGGPQPVPPPLSSRYVRGGCTH